MFAWEQRKLGEVGKTFTGLSGKTKEDFGHGDAHFVTYMNVYSNPISDPNMVENVEIDTKQQEVKKGDVFFTTSSETPEEVGMSSVWLSDAPHIYLNSFCFGFRPTVNIFNPYYLAYLLRSNNIRNKMMILAQGISRYNISKNKVMKLDVTIPNIREQQKIGEFFKQLDTLITLHQRKPFIKNGGIKMITSNFTCDSLFKDYFEFWIKLYKEGAVRPVTLEKYRNNQKHIAKIIPNLKMKDFDRNAYQELLNQYALTHERQTVIDFHHQVKGAILDAVDDGLIDRDPTRKAIFKGKAPREKKQKYLNQFELHNLLEDLDLGMEITWDWLILLIAKTGLRFSEALGLTPADFDFARQTISVNKTWDYKTNTGFQPTKNRSSIRKVQMDWQLGMQFQHLIKNLNEDEPIFVNGPVCNSTPNNCLARHCRKCGIPEISIHGLRHTHASLLMFAGVSIASVSRRLGHSSITTTQKVYMHIISELENQDNDLVMRYLSSLS